MKKKLFISLIIIACLYGIFRLGFLICDNKENQFLEQNKQDINNTYQKAWNYCHERTSDKDENGFYINAGSGFVEYCIGEYLWEKDIKYYKIYDKIWNYCIKTTDTMYEQRNCLIETFENKIKK